MSVGCFGYSDIDRWMARNLDRHLDYQEPGSRTLSFKLFKGRKLIREWTSEVSDEDSCYHEMHDELVEIHTATMRKYLKDMTSGQSLFYRSNRQCLVYNPEDCKVYFGSVDEFKQKHIIEKWSRLPKEFHISNKQFNLVRMGKYSVVCNDPLSE